MRYTQGDNPMAIGRVSIAIDSGYGDKKKTNFFNCVSFGKQAENLERFVQKGNRVLLECEANQESYTDKNGNKVNTVSFIVKNFELIEPKNASAGGSAATPKTDENGFINIPDGIDDELPFA